MHITNKRWNQVCLHACCSCLQTNPLPSKFLQIRVVALIMHCKVSLRVICKPTLLPATFFSPVYLLSAPSPPLHVDLESQQWSGVSSGRASCRFVVWPWGHFWARCHNGAPTEPGPVGRMVLSCRQDFQTLETSNSSCSEGTQPSRDCLAGQSPLRKDLFAVINIIGLPPNPAVDKRLTVSLLIKKLKCSFSLHSSSTFLPGSRPQSLK